MGLSHLWIITSLAFFAVASIDRYHPENKADISRAIPTNPGEDTAEFWYKEAWAGIQRRITRGSRTTGGQKAKNIVMFLGDGMSVPTLAAARTLLGQRSGVTGEEGLLNFEKFPTTGLTKTYCINAQIPDSACTATSYLCGVKSNQGTLGVTAAVPRWDCEASTNLTNRVPSISEWALDDGRDVGLVTTTRVTHASPGGMFAKTANRHWENDWEVINGGGDTFRCPDLTHQLVHMHPGNKFKVILGGGRQQFISTSMVDEENGSGLRTDNRNIIREWETDKQDRDVSHKYVWNRDQLMEVFNDPPEYLLGLFENNHLQYNLQRNETEPTLAELTEIAIRSLSRNDKGFFLFVEGGRIDHAHHDNWAELALDETIEMDKAAAKAAEMLSEEDSLIVVTADHAHVMAFNGYSPRGQSIIGRSNSRGKDAVPYMTLSYTNGPGARGRESGVRSDVTLDEDFGGVQWRTHADVPLDSETHAGDDVAVFARGPQHSMFSGLYEQSQIPHLMAYAACIGPGPQACDAE